MRQAVIAVEARRKEEWDRFAYGLCWVVNAMPNFGKTRRAVIPMYRFNPLSRRERAAMRDAVFDALWDVTPEAPQ